MVKPADHAARMVASAGAYLKSVGCEPEGFVVTIVCDSQEHTFRQDGAVSVSACLLDAECTCGRGCVRVPASMIAVDANPVSLYGELETKILVGLRTAGGWIVTAALATDIGADLTKELRITIQNLSVRGALETNQKLGVRITNDGLRSLSTTDMSGDSTRPKQHVVLAAQTVEIGD